MKKKIINVLIILIIFITGTKGVAAAEVDSNGYSIFKYNDEYQFTIKNIILNIYERNEESSEEDSKKYFSEQPTRTVKIPLNGVNITPTYKEDKIFGNPALYINLNYAVEEELFRNYLQEEINAVSDKKSYVVDFLLEYSLDSYPSEYTKFYRYQFLRGLVNGFENIFGDENVNPYSDMEINPSNDITQLLNNCLIEKKDDNVALTYYNSAEQLAAKDSLGQATNFLIESKTELKSGDSSFDKLILFHNFSDEEYFINKIKEQSAEENIDTPSSENFSLNPKTDISDEKTKDDNQIVKVDNTSANKSSIIIFLSIFMIIIGVIVIISTISIKKSRAYNN